uniref:hypothetical protein n=1 Tax=Streptomyces kanamyceticus TaxID=1967 RepID=UPI000ACE8872
MTPGASCPHPGCAGTLTSTGYCLASGERVDPDTGLHSAAPAPRAPVVPGAPDESSQHWIVDPGVGAAECRP